MSNVPPVTIFPARRRGPRHARDRRADRRALMLRVGGLAVAAASAGGLLAISLPSQTEAAAPVDSAVTVTWDGDTSAAKDYQPARVPTSVHYSDFQNLSVTVAQTQDLGDQAIRVTVTGMGQTRAVEDGTGRIWTSAQNYMQAMQCWGDPASPEFRQTCAWGGRALVANNGLGDSVYRDNVYRVSERDLLPTVADGVDVPFVRAVGSSITGRQVENGGLLEYPLFGVLGPSSTNEVQAARIGSGSSSSFEFEAQSATVSPSLGCGSSSANLRCWLVLVPRGSHFGGADDHCSYILDANLQQYGYGRANSIQGGSPLNPACDYWDNRMVIPLDFKPVATSCPQSTATRALIGSQLMLSAITSWQLDLCTRLGVAYSFASNPDAVARLQLLDGQAGLAFGSFPIVKTELDDTAAEQAFDQTALSYAPVAIGAAAIAFYAEGPDGRIEDLHLTPRLMAKLLTQSYTFTVPKNAEAPDKNIAHLPAKNRTYEYLWQDPDFQNANPNYARFTANPSIVLPGPAGADAIKQVWRWIVADDEARAWLAGGDDGNGMTINPYYLPAGDPKAKVPVFDANGDYVYVAGSTTVKATRAVGLRNADGTPMKIGEQTLDRFLKVDESEVPLKITVPNQTPFGTLQAFPYVNGFAEAALKAFRADPNAKTVWDPTKKNASGGDGDWVTSGAQLPGSRFMIGITDLASAHRYALDSAQLRLANSGIYGVADDDGMTAALTYLTAGAVPSYKQVDPSAVVSGYPLTTVVYAAVNLSKTDAAARKDFAAFLKEASSRGQQQGAGIGDLPIGYLPLTSEMVTQTTAAAAAISSYVAPTPRPTSSSTANNGYAMDDYTEGGFGDESSTDDPKAEITPGVDDGSDGRTPVASVQPIGQAGLAVSLGAGVAGALFAPLLFRRRGLL